MSRTTIKQLNIAVKRLNDATGNSVEPWTRNKEGKSKANPGNYHIDACYGGYRLAQMTNTGGGMQHISPERGTKTDIYNQIHAILNVIYNRGI